MQRRPVRADAERICSLMQGDSPQEERKALPRAEASSESRNRQVCNVRHPDLDKADTSAFHSTFLHVKKHCFTSEDNSSVDGAFHTRQRIEEEARTLTEVPVNFVA